MKKLVFFTASFFITMQAQAAPSATIACTDDTVTFTMSNLTIDSTFTLEVSQDGSSNWISLGGADAPSASLTVPANVTGSDELNALTNPQTATYRVTSGGASVTATCP